MKFLLLFFSIFINVCLSAQSCSDCNILGKWHRVKAFQSSEDERWYTFRTDNIENVNINSEYILATLDSASHRLEIETNSIYTIRDNCLMILNGFAVEYVVIDKENDCSEVVLALSDISSVRFKVFSRDLVLITDPYIGPTNFYVNLGDNSGSVLGASSNDEGSEVDCPELSCPSIEISYNLVSGDDKTVQFINNSTGASAANWDFGDGSLSTNLSPKYTYQDSGGYDICLTMSNVCEDEKTQCTNVSFDFTSPVDNVIETNFTVSPVPASDELIVDSNFKSGLHAEIYSISGALIKTVTLNHGMNKLDVYPLLSGTYVLKTKKGSIQFLKN